MSFLWRLLCHPDDLIHTGRAGSKQWKDGRGSGDPVTPQLGMTVLSRPSSPSSFPRLVFVSHLSWLCWLWLVMPFITCYMLNFSGKICLVAILQSKLLTPTLCFTVPVACVTFSELSIQNLSSLLLSLCFLRHTGLEAIKSPLAILSPAPQKLWKTENGIFLWAFPFVKIFSLLENSLKKKKTSLFSFHITIPAPTASPPPAPPAIIHGIFSHPLSRWLPLYL